MQTSETPSPRILMHLEPDRSFRHMSLMACDELLCTASAREVTMTCKSLEGPQCRVDTQSINMLGTSYEKIALKT